MVFKVVGVNKGLTTSITTVGLIFFLTLCNGCRGPLEIEKSSGPNPWTHLKFNNNPEDFQFAIMSDRTGRVRPGVFAEAIDKVNLLRPEFVITVGDIIEGYHLDEEGVHSEWDKMEAIINRLKMPFFYLPGNHDINSEATRQVWQQRFGSDYYHFIYHDVLFLCLNASGPVDDEQIEHFSGILKNNKDVRWTLVFLHKPRWVREDTSDWDKFEPLLADRNYTVFAGHMHQYKKEIRHGKNYYTLATTGGKSGMSGPLYGEFDHITWVTMTDNGPQIANLVLDGILDDDPVRPLSDK